MSEIIDLLRRVQTLQRIPEKKRDNENDDAFEARVAAREAEIDEWIGSLYHKANSVSWTHSKAVRYGNDLRMIWDALRFIGVKSDGNTHAADIIRRLKMPEHT